MSEVLNYLILDVETGGLKNTEVPITQFGCIGLDGDSYEELLRWESFVRNYNNLTYQKQALAVTGITMEQIASGISSSELVKQIITICQQLNPSKKAKLKPIVCGHNIKFDMGFLDYLFKYEKEDIYKYVNEITYDTMAFARTKYVGEKTLPNYKLATVVEASGFILNNAHSALGDVEATTEVIKSFLKGIRNTGSVNSTGESSNFRKRFEL